MADERLNALPAGSEFEGYRIEAVLGAGGFGITYRATEVLLNRQVAIKEYLPAGMATRKTGTLEIAPLGATETADYDWGLERFRSEAQTLVNFRHPNIVPVHRYFEAHGSGYLVMEYVEGRTLAELLRPDKTLDEDEIREILDPILDGVEAVHEKGFLHRDIKPANIFIRADGSPVLIDFGAARQALGQHSNSLTSIISAGYAPYEQYDSTSEQGPWTDIYALGGVLYRCVTGKVPPEAPARVSAVIADKEDPLQPATEVGAGSFSVELLEGIDKALAIKSDDRPQSVGDLRGLLGSSATITAMPTASQAVADAQTIIAGAAPVGAADRGSPENKKTNWKIVAPLAAMIIGGVAVGAWALLSGESAACKQAAVDARAALAKSDLATARRHIASVSSSDCDDSTLADLQRQATALDTRLKAEAERKRQEAARRKAEADAAWRKLVRDKKALIEKERRERAAEEKRRAEAEKKRLEEAKRLFKLQPQMAWERTFGGKDHDFARAIIELPDKRLVAFGSFSSGSNKKSNGWVLGLDANGKKLWNKTLGGEWYSIIHGAAVTSGGGVIAVGSNQTNQGNQSWVLRLNAGGNLLSEHNSRDNLGAEALSVATLKDGGFMVAGYHSIKPEGKKRRWIGWIRRFDKDRKLLWEKSQGTVLNSFVRLSDGSFAAVGLEDGGKHPDAMVLRYDRHGKLVWKKTFGGQKADRAHSIVEMPNGELSVVGVTFSKGAGKGDVWMIRLNARGERIWDRTYGGKGDDDGIALLSTADGGFLVLGTTESKGVGSGDVWLLRTDGSGNVLWDRTYGGKAREEAASMLISRDGSLVLLADTQSRGAGKSDFWIMRLGYKK